MSGEAAAGADPAARLVERVESLRRSRPAEAWDALAGEFVAASRGASDRRRGELWRLRGHVLRALGRLRPAAAAYRRAQDWYRRAGDSRELGRCAIGLVDALMYLGRYREAEREASSGRRALAKAGDRAAEARLLNNEGNLYHRLDRPDLALERYRRARGHLARAGDRQGAGMIEGNIANCLSLLGRTGEARRLYTGARRASAKAGHALDALNADYSLAYLDFLEHRHERALAGLERVRETALGDGAASIVALSGLDRAEILLRLGDHDAALEEARAAVAAFQALGMGYERAKAETFAALAEFRLGRPAAARARLERTLAAFLEEGNAVWAGESLVGLATLWWSQGNPAAAAGLLAAAARRFAWAADLEREGCALALLTRARLEAGGRDAARPLIRARRLAARRPSARLSHLTWVAAAELAASRGNRAAARRHLTRAARESERLAARILDEQWRASFWGDWGWPHQALAALEMDAGRPEAAFEALEGGRGRALASPWRGRGATALRGWAAGRLARDRQRSTRSAAIEIGPAVRPSAGLRRALAAPVAPAIRARAMVGRMAPGTVLLDFALHRGQLAAFVLRRGRLELAQDLARESELSRLAHDALFDLRHAALEPRETRRAAPRHTEALAEVASLVLWPLLARAGGIPEVLEIVPAGPLARLPWAALPLPDGRPLCSACQVVVVPGLRLGQASRHGKPTQGAPLVVASNAEGLENVTPEAEAVSAALPGSILLAGPEATAERFMALASSAPWVHFAGHGVYQAGRAGLRLFDRWVLAEELGSLALPARGFVLSACQTARALVRPGEEWFGLPRSLLLAGAQAVVASQWDVDDAAASRFMTGVYGRLGAGESLGRAVAGVQAARAAAGDHPFDWAGFVVLGGPKAAGARPWSAKPTAFAMGQ